MSTPTDRLIPFWRSGQMQAESCLFITPSSGGLAVATLLFTPEGPLSVRSATGDIEFLDPLDYTIDRIAGVLTRTPDSRMPETTIAELQPTRDPDGSGFMHVRDDPARFLLVDETGLFHRRQVEVSYAFNRAQWTGKRPAFSGAALPLTLARLRRAEPLTIGLLGDSISAGYNASGFIGVPPYQPPYGALVAADLERVYGSAVMLGNFAVGGWTSDNGLYATEAVAAEQPHLVVVAFGMNDAGYAAAGDFAVNIGAIVEGIRRTAPQAEFILVASMLPNPDWHYPQMERFPAYRDALANLCGPGVILADMTTLWLELMRRKSPYDLTGNGINHPNDWGHRLYAQTILSLLTE
jgi:acyl-CoA thioesterase-1